MNHPAPFPSDPPRVSFVLPCLNEARTLAACIDAAARCIARHNLNAEIVIADNGSTDASRQIALDRNARVVEVPTKGYGAALRAGIQAARGELIVMADSDESYDLAEAGPFIDALERGADLVMGNRFPTRGGTIRPGAMPWKHRWIGNPALSGIGRLLFQSPVGDLHCGMRAFRRSALLGLGLRTTGMEFASEMVVKATLAGLTLAEVPITLHKDNRGRPPHLRSWRDGWRHLKFMLLLSPRWTLFVPGLALVTLGLILTLWVGIGPAKVGGVTLDVHTLIASSLMMLLGTQAVLTAGALRVHALENEIGPATARVRFAFAWLTPGWGMLAGAIFAALGLLLIALPLSSWIRADLGDLDTRETLRPMILGATLIALGGQFAMMGFVFGMMRLSRVPR